MYFKLRIRHKLNKKYRLCSTWVAYISIICKFGFFVLKFDFFKHWFLTNTNYEYFTIHYRYNIGRL